MRWTTSSSHALLTLSSWRRRRPTSSRGQQLVKRATILAHIGRVLEADSALQGKRVVVTAGPTREPIDPVRFISNHSSGKMGIAIADALAAAGATVKLVLGPTRYS